MEGKKSLLPLFLAVVVFVVFISLIVLAIPRKKQIQGDFEISFDHEEKQIQIVNVMEETAYNCSFSIAAKGDGQIFRYFFRNFTLPTCQQALLKNNYACRVNRWAYTKKNLIPSITMPKLESGKPIDLELSRFYFEQVRPANAFLRTRSPEDAKHLAITCLNPEGDTILSEIPLE